MQIAVIDKEISNTVGLTAQQRKDRANKAIATRWDRTIPTVTHGDEFHPLIIGNIQLPCYVLSNKQRVISQNGIITALGMSCRGGKLISFVQGKILEPYINNDLIHKLENPTRFRGNGGLTYGYDATILVDICDAVLSANEEGKLLKQQEHIAKRCGILVRGFAKVGIIALIDEVTGYQHDRSRDDLSNLLELYVAPELQPYVKKFPTNFYFELCKIRGIPFAANSIKRPQYFGYITNDIIYSRLPKGVLEKIKQERDNEKHSYMHQWLTPDSGTVALKVVLGIVIALMKTSRDWTEFKDKLDVAQPTINTTIPKPPELENDDGIGM